MLAVLLPEDELGAGIAAVALYPLSFLTLSWCAPVRGWWPAACVLSAYLATAITTLRFDPPWGVPFLVSVYGLIGGIVVSLVIRWRTRKTALPPSGENVSHTPWLPALMFLPLIVAFVLYVIGPSKASFELLLVLLLLVLVIDSGREFVFGQITPGIYLVTGLALIAMIEVLLVTVSY